MDHLEESFIDDVRDLLNSLEECFLEIGQDKSNNQLLEQAFRDLHSIKGAAYMFDLKPYGDFMHRLETIYDGIRNGEYEVNDEIIQGSLNAIDFAKQSLQDPQFDQAETKEQAEQILKLLEKFLTKKSTSGSEHTSDKNKIKAFLLEIEPSIELDTNDGHPLHFLMADLKENTSEEVIILKKEGEEKIEKWKLLFTSEQPKEEIESLFMFMDNELNIFLEGFEPGVDQQIKKSFSGFKEVMQQKSGSDLAKALSSQIFIEDKNISIENSNQQTKKGKTSKKKLKDKIQQSSYIKVSRKKIDDLMSWVSELITMQATLQVEAQKFESETLMRVSENMEFISENLRETIFSVSLVPIKRLETRFNRLIHDLSASLGKKVNFTSTGNDTELDKRVIENLTDPLLHILRNCIDHGIEAPEARKAKGKGEAGTIHLKSYYSGNHVIIEIEDDGKGIDTSKIRSKAIERGLIGKEDNLKKEELLYMIFQAGFSTAKEVSDVSGRGVGMDVVRRKIQEIRGEVFVESEVDKGTKLTIKIPLSLSIIDGLLTQVGNTKFVLPLSTIREIHRVEKESFEKVPEGSQLIEIDGSQKSFISLEKTFGIEAGTNQTSDIIMVDVGINKKGVAVDEIHGQIRAVIKPLSEYYEAQEYISGGTILGDGNLALILDINKLITKN